MAAILSCLVAVMALAIQSYGVYGGPVAPGGGTMLRPCSAAPGNNPGWTDWTGEANMKFWQRTYSKGGTGHWMGKGYTGSHSTSRSLYGMFTHYGRVDSEMRAEFDRRANVAGTLLLEIGCGEGRATLEALALYPSWNAHCINYPGYKSTTNGGRGLNGANKNGSKKELFKVALHYNVKLQSGTAVPKLSYADVGYPWNIPTGTVDLIMTQAAITKVYNIETTVQEAMRVLAPGGRAFLGIGSAVECKAIFGKDESHRVGACFYVRQGNGPRVLAKSVLNLNPGKTPGAYSTPYALMLEKEHPSQPMRMSCPDSMPTSTAFYEANRDAIDKGCKRWTPCAFQHWDRINTYLASVRAP